MSKFPLGKKAEIFLTLVPALYAFYLALVFTDKVPGNKPVDAVTFFILVFIALIMRRK